MPGSERPIPNVGREKGKNKLERGCQRKELFKRDPLFRRGTRGGKIDFY